MLMFLLKLVKTRGKTHDKKTAKATIKLQNFFKNTRHL